MAHVQGRAQQVSSIILVQKLMISALRHIRLMNQPEQKPVTIQRDTTEMDYKAACDMIDVFLEYQNKPGGTSLLQDESYYEVSTSAHSCLQDLTMAHSNSWRIGMLALPCHHNLQCLLNMPCTATIHLRWVSHQFRPSLPNGEDD